MPVYTTVPAPAAYTGWPGLPARSTPRWPRFQSGDGASKARITAGGGRNGHCRRAASPLAGTAQISVTARIVAAHRTSSVHRDAGKPASQRCGPSTWPKRVNSFAQPLICELTSRVCIASPVPLGVRTHAGGPVQQRVRHRSSRQGPASPVAGRQPTHKGIRMAVVTMKQLLDSGTHFGHQTRRWNPKMKRFIFTDRNGIYIIDLQQTLTFIDKAYEFVKETVAHGGTVLFVGTKKQAQESIADEATRVGMPYVSQRWLGGMLTNFSTVHKRLQRLKELEAMEQTGGFEGRTK